MIAVALTLIAAGLIFAALGKDPLEALYVYFVEPLTQAWSLQELVVKAAPLVLIAIGLSFCYLSNNWNIGAEGQYVIGAIAGGAVALALQGTETVFAVPLDHPCRHRRRRALRARPGPPEGRASAPTRS